MSKPGSKPFEISKQVVAAACEKVRSKKGAAGVDGVTVEQFAQDYKNNLYKLWNRMSSGSYFPAPVQMVEIPKDGDRGTRVLGVPTVADRVAQTVAVAYLEPLMEPVFHTDSYGFRPGRCQLDAVATCRQRCWRHAWVIDVDIQGFFDNLDHDLVLKGGRPPHRRGVDPAVCRAVACCAAAPRGRIGGRSGSGQPARRLDLAVAG